MHRARDVLERPFAEILEGQRQLVLHVVAHGARDADAARLGQRLESRGDVHAVTVNVVILDDDVAEIDPDPEPDLPVRRHVPSALRHALLQLDRAADGVDHTGELDQRAVAHELDDAAVVLGDLRLDEVPAQGLERGERARLVGRHEPRVADDVRSEYRRQPARHQSGPCAIVPG